MVKFTDEFVRDIARGVSTRFLDQQSVPQARWQDVEGLLGNNRVTFDPEQRGERILVGALGEKLIGIDDNRHMMTVAGSRSGKSVTLVANLLLYRGSVLALDPKGELANLTARRRKALGQAVYVLDPFLTCADHVAPFRCRYNPLAVLQIGGPTVVEDAGMIADALVVAGNEKDPHWDESARSFIEGLILHIVSAPTYKGRRTLVTLRDLLRDSMISSDDEASAFALELEMYANAERLSESNSTADLANAIETATREFYEKPDRERAGVLSTARRHTKFLDYQGMRRVLSGHDFDLSDLKRTAEGQTVFLCLPASRMGLCNRWLRLFINQLLDAMEREKTKPAAPVLACLDEFPVLGYMRQLEDAAGQIASFDVKLWVFLQDWGQGKALYGDRWETFAANAGVLQFFGNNDMTTMEYISRRLGKTVVAVARENEVSANQSADGLSGKSRSLELYDLLTPDEVGRQFARSDRLKRQLVIWAGYNPMILQRVEYFDKQSPLHHIFAGKYDEV